MIEMTEIVALLEAGEDQDASKTVNPVLDLDEEIRMLNLVGGESELELCPDLEESFRARPEVALGTECLL